MVATKSLAHEIGDTKAACLALRMAKATYYRHRNPPAKSTKVAPRPPLALSDDERQKVLEELRSDRFVDSAPLQVWAELLDEKRYLCSPRTMYRILESENEVRERRNQLSRTAYSKPELLATGPNQVWSWDITKLKGPKKWNLFYLYVILDIFSRYVVGWMLAHRESKSLAKRLIADTIEKQGVAPGQLTLHADRGSSMTSKPVAQLLSDLEVTKTHNRPYTSNDNPYSEAQFKTLKYHPGFPQRFDSFEDGRAFCKSFFKWYNHEHHHSGLALLAPADVHHGRAQEILEGRAAVLRAAFEAHPQRFKGRMPQPGSLPEAVWINKPPEPNSSVVSADIAASTK
jgi:putative transposase